MKKILLASVVLLGTYGYGQTKVNGYTVTSTKESDGSTHTVYTKDRYKGAWKTYDLDKQEGDSTAVKDVYRTSDVAIYHGDKHPVYLSKSGKLFIWVNRDGQTYRKYIK